MVTALKMKQPTVAITGSLGYIGGAAAARFAQLGWKVIGCDISQPSEISGNHDLFIRASFDSAAWIEACCDADPSVIIHTAALSNVGESVAAPLLYMESNVAALHRFTNGLAGRGWRGQFVFCSSAAVYGCPTGKITESTPLLPVNPYGASKVIGESNLAAVSAAAGWTTSSLRFFNVAGGVGAGQHGQRAGAHHLIARALTASADCPLEIFGTDWDESPDGSAIRDYIHIDDVVSAIIALVSSAPSWNYRSLNLGTGLGYSVLQVVAEVERHRAHGIPIKFTSRRCGDPAVLISDSSAIMNLTDWKPTASSLCNIIQSAAVWHRNQLPASVENI